MARSGLVVSIGGNSHIGPMISMILSWVDPKKVKRLLEVTHWVLPIRCTDRGGSEDVTNHIAGIVVVKHPLRTALVWRLGPATHRRDVSVVHRRV